MTLGYYQILETGAFIYSTKYRVIVVSKNASYKHMILDIVSRKKCSYYCDNKLPIGWDARWHTVIDHSYFKTFKGLMSIYDIRVNL